MFLVLNLGLKSIRAILFDSGSNLINTSSLPLTTFVNDMAVEQSADEWWNKGLKCIDECLSGVSFQGRLQGFTVTASSSCMVPVDGSGHALDRVMMVSDARPTKEATCIETLPSYTRLREAGRIIESNQSLMLPKILWLKNNKPAIYEAADYFLSPNDYFIYKLTGQPITDVLNAEKYFFDTATWCYPKDLMDDIGIDSTKLPMIQQTGSFVGSIICGDLGGKLTGVPLVCSTYDAICAFIGSGVCVAGEGSDVSGTVTSLRVLSNDCDEAFSQNIFMQHESTFDITISGASNNLGGGLIEWLKQSLYSDTKNPYGLIESEASAITDGCEGLIFLPYLMGERAPLWNENARGVFFGLGRQHRRPHMARAVFESAGFALKSLSDEVEISTNVELIKVSGGLARINLINQIKADILNKPIHVLDEFETTAIGALCYLLKWQNPDLTLERLASRVSIRQIILPNERKHEAYSRRYELFKDVYTALTPSFSKLNTLHVSKVYSVSETIENM